MESGPYSETLSRIPWSLDGPKNHEEVEGGRLWN